MIMDSKMLKRFLIAGILIGMQGCAGVTLNPFVEKPYFASPPAQLTRADEEIFDRALFRQTNNRIQPAIKVWKQFLEKHPRSFEAHNNLGLVYFEDDQVDAAIAELETAMSLEPSEAKIKNNLIRVLKFKSTLFKEARDYNQAVDTLRRVQGMSSPKQKEKLGFRIEELEDKAFEQTKRINTLAAYEGFLQRYPTSTKNSEEARMKIEELQHMAAAIPEDTVETLPETPLASAENEGVAAGAAMLEGAAGMENKENMAGGTPIAKDLTEINMESAVTGEKPPVEKSSALQALEKLEAAGQAPPAVASVDKGFIPVQPLEVPRSAEQKIEIATQPEPKPATGAHLFPTLEPDGSSQDPEVTVPNPEVTIPTLEEPPEVAEAQQKQVKIVTNRDPLRVREDPTLDSQVLGTVAKDSLVPLISDENGWYKIEFSAGKMGWISKKYSQLVE
jgi:Bacterial SH3 domain